MDLKKIIFQKDKVLLIVIFLVAYLVGFLTVNNFNNEQEVNTRKLNLDGGEYFRFVFIGSSSCTFSNNEEMYNIINQLNKELRILSKEMGKDYISTGIATDVSASVGISYLEKTGKYDEVIAGGSWYNIGINHYIWNPDIGYASTPQVLLVITNFKVISGGFDIFDIEYENRLLKRYMGSDKIKNLHKIVESSNLNQFKKEVGLL